MARLLRHSVGAFAIIAMGVFTSSGCGPGIKDRGVVRGKVTVGSKALNMGTVQFITSDNRSGVATIKEDGSYEMLDAPQGECKILVMVGSGGGRMSPEGMAMGMKGAPGAPKAPPMSGKRPAGPKPPPGGLGGGDGMQMVEPPAPPDLSKAVKIPEKYSKLESTDLTYTVVKGEQTHDIVLNP
jgi:hypothetical protein